MSGTFTYPSCPSFQHLFDDEQIWDGGDGCQFNDTDILGLFKCPECGVSLMSIYDPIPQWEIEIDEEV